MATRTRPRELAEQPAKGMFIASLLVVVLATTLPFDFSSEDVIHKLFRFFAFGIKEPGFLDDVIRNVLLFVPLGFSTANLTQTRHSTAKARFAAVMIVCFSSSIAVEVLQLFLPGRISSLADVISNSFGAFLGFLCYRRWGVTVVGVGSTLREKILERNRGRRLALCFCGYTAVLLLVSILLQNASTIRGWDPAYTLVLGNEHTADRPWRGNITELIIADKAISEGEVAQVLSGMGRSALPATSLLAEYELKGDGPYRDRTEHLPELRWEGRNAHAQGEAGVSLAPDHWLETETPVTFLTRRILQTSEFTLCVTTGSADVNQTGPARIVSVSTDPYNRNFTLGQEGNDLIFRLRTLATGKNGTDPELVIPNVFSDAALHRILITYSGSNFRAYLDSLGNQYSLEFNPGLTIFTRLFPATDRIKASTLRSTSYKLLYDGLVFTPLGFLLALGTIGLNRHIVLQGAMVCVGLVLPPVLLETSLAGISRRGMKAENILLDVAITLAAMWLFARRGASSLQAETTGQ
jgi:glycopeptide antibiotics resistance protein